MMLLAVIALAYGWAINRWWRRRGRLKLERLARQCCADAFVGISDDVRAGQDYGSALRVAVTSLRDRFPHSGWSRVLAVADHHGDVAEALREMPAPFALPCQRLAAAWQLLDVGIPLADVLERLEHELSSWRHREDRLAAEIAGSRTTAIVLAGLPLVGLGFGYLLGANSFEVLLHTTVGAGCLLLAVALQLLGWEWSQWLCRMSPNSPKRLFIADLPYAADLLGAVLRAGAATPHAVAVVAGALAGPVGKWLGQVGGQLQSGFSAGDAWVPAEAAMEESARLASCAVRAEESGAALAGACHRLAVQLRRHYDTVVEAQARRIGVLMVFPLVACFLPAFVAIGVIPIVIDLLTEVTQWSS